MLLQGLKRDATALRVIYDLPYITRVELRVGSSTFLLALMRYVSVVRLVRLSLSLSMLKTALAVEAAVLRPKSFISVNARNVKMAQSTVEL